MEHRARVKKMHELVALFCSHFEEHYPIAWDTH